MGRKRKREDGKREMKIRSIRRHGSCLRAKRLLGMIMRKSIVLGLALVLSGTTLAGQSRLQFVDAVTGEPVPYVHVIFGENEGKYADEGGMVTIPDGVLTVRSSHISYEPAGLDLGVAGEKTVRLTPVVTELRPAIIVPKNLKRKTIGNASAKGVSGHGGKNGFSLAEYFNLPDSGANTALVSAVTLNLNTVNLKRSMTAKVDGEEYSDGVMHVAKLRVDLRDVDPATGAPGRSLIDGGVIYSIKDNFNLNLHNKTKVSLPQPAVFPEEGLFVVVEWIVTDDVRVQDSVTPSIWCTRAENGPTSWIKWPIGTEWRPYEMGPYDEYEKSFCISLDLLL
jgi:hypothetical protein